MRHVIYLLIIANLVYFSWNMLQNIPETEGADPGRRVAPDVRRLAMLDERAATKDSSNAEDIPVMSVEIPPIASQPRDSAAAQGGAAIAPVEALTKAEPPGAVLPSLNCHVFGPLLDVAQMKRIETRLNALGYSPRERTRDLPVEAGYSAYLPGMQREEALRVARLLKENHDRDYLIVRGNAISLGAYVSRTQADMRAKMLRKYGLEAVVEPRYETRTVYWLDLDLPGDERALLETIRTEYPSVQMQDAACPSIAADGVVN